MNLDQLHGQHQGRPYTGRSLDSGDAGSWGAAVFKVEQTEIAGKKVFSVADGYLIACFDKDVTEDVVTAIAKQQPFYAVFRDSSMANDSVAANFEQIFATYSPQTVRKVL
jgi:hypothetical protein